MEQISTNLSEQTQDNFFTLSHLVGCAFMVIISGLSSLAGLGGGGPNITLLILFFNILPKDATIMVFACVFGSACGNMVNQMRRVLDGQPVVNYGYASFTIPLMFIGPLFGVLLNKFLPSLGTVSLILFIALRSLPAIYIRFKQGYEQETLEIKQHEQNSRKSGVLKQRRINPFESYQNIRIFKILLIMIFGYIILSLFKGSQKFPSLIGIQNCSMLFWGIQLVIIAFAWYFFKVFVHLYQFQQATAQSPQEPLLEKQDIISENWELILKNSLGAGMFSGLGLGGGIFLVPLYRQLNSTPVQASSTGAFTVFITSGLNVIQALFLGVLSLKQFFFLFSLTFFGGYGISYLVSMWLRKIHRTSIVEFLLFFLVLLSSIYLPYSLWAKVQKEAGDWSIILGFGSLC